MGGAVMAVILNASTSSGLVTTADNSGQFAFQSNGTQFNPLLTAATAQASTSGTSITFTSIPSWVKRITVMFNGVSISGSSNILIQIGSGSFSTSGYTAISSACGAAPGATTYTTGFGIFSSVSTNTIYGSNSLFLLNASTNLWVASGVTAQPSAAYTHHMGGGVTLSGTLDRVRITTVNGTDTFTAGSINIMYE